MRDLERTVYVVPHTHWDREWYATFETFRAQLVELWDELLALTETDPDFRFLMDGQTVVIDDYLEVRPEAKARLDGAIRRGQIQVGPWYTLPDEFLVSGETLVRDLQRGLVEAEAHGGSLRAGYLPDSFGHAAQMPQIYRQLGFRHAVVWRGVPLQIDRVAFIWEAPDGSRILTAYMGNSYSHGVDLPTDPEALAARIKAALTAIEPFHPTNDILLMNGNDHVLPQRKLTQAVKAASDHLNHTRIRLARLDDYLAVIAQGPWPTWRGELRSSARANVLMGTLSVRAPDKQLYARAIRTLERLAEPAAALSGVDMTEPLQRTWTLILQNAAHDTACGSGIDAVAQAARGRSGSALQLANDILDRCLPTLTGEGEVWNPSAFPRQGVIEVNGRTLLTPMIPGCSSGRLEDVSPAGAVSASARQLENGHLRVELNPNGSINVLDKRSGVRYLDLGRLVDEADAGDEYNFSPPPEPDDPIGTTVRGAAWSVIEAGPLRGRVDLRADQCIQRGLRADRRRRSAESVDLPVRLVVTLDADSPRLDLELEIENRATDHRLRAHFPLPFITRESAADTPFHVTRRAVTEPHRDPGAPEVELPTYPMRSFVDVSDGRNGLALITDGLHEYEVLTGKPQVLALTLIRAVGWLSRDDLLTRTGHAGPAMETPGAQVPGHHHFHFSLYFHGGDWEQASVWRVAEATLVPLQLGRGSTREAVTPKIEVEPDCIQMTACVPQGNGFTLRLLNASDRAREANLRLRPRPTRIEAVSLGGEPQEPATIAADGAKLSIRPWEIVTLRVSR